MMKEVSIALPEDAVPYQKPICYVAQSMEAPLKAELDHLASKGILVKMTPEETINWLSSFVCVKKPNGKICLCFDPTQLNKYIIRP